MHSGTLYTPVVGVLFEVGLEHNFLYLVGRGGSVFEFLGEVGGLEISLPVVALVSRLIIVILIIRRGPSSERGKLVLYS